MKKKNWLGHLLIIAVISALFIGVLTAFYFLWSPGVDLRDGRNDLQSNGIWLRHNWLGADEWFQRTGNDFSHYRNESNLKKLADDLKSKHIKDVFPHLCPSSPQGNIAPSDQAQVEKFLNAFDGFRVLPWVGGVYGSDVKIEDAQWRTNFAKSCAKLINEHPRLAGIHINIEPLRSGNKDFLLLLEEMRQTLPQGKIISVAAYPPPCIWQQTKELHWDEDYSRKVASLVDQATIMMYDTGLTSPGMYQQQMKDWTHEVLTWYHPKEVLLGIPAYEDAGVGHHDPATENLTNALLGIHAGLEKPHPVSYKGVSIYSEWEMNSAKWKLFQGRFCAPDFKD